MFQNLTKFDPTESRFKSNSIIVQIAIALILLAQLCISSSNAIASDEAKCPAFSPEQVMKLARHQNAEKMHAAALDCLTAGIDKNPNDRDLKIARIRTLAWGGDFARALQEVDILKSDDQEILELRGDLAWFQNQTSQAEKHYKAAMNSVNSDGPLNQSILLKLVKSEIALDDNRDAFKQCQRIGRRIEIEPELQATCQEVEQNFRREEEASKTGSSDSKPAKERKIGLRLSHSKQSQNTTRGDVSVFQRLRFENYTTEFELMRISASYPEADSETNLVDWGVSANYGHIFAEERIVAGTKVSAFNQPRFNYQYQIMPYVEWAFRKPFFLTFDWRHSAYPELRIDAASLSLGVYIQSFLFNGTVFRGFGNSKTQSGKINLKWFLNDSWFLDAFYSAGTDASSRPYLSGTAEAQFNALGVFLGAPLGATWQSRLGIEQRSESSDFEQLTVTAEVLWSY
jgi:hypothetical protein